ncbi:MAG TPA: SOS response-associated peptidase [Spirochaetota bacterium]|nr:SOS response-associated peptidase [Spirochaetota bacterium]HPI88226.1 SOS response-associated peptidase [Spirochaetota bacterium]HPR47230.1 SOS response-associated peptidase [Spirochaetota bacterium]
MCGRFAQTIPLSEIVKEFFIDEIETGLPPCYNIAPGQRIIAVISPEKARKLVDYQWGLVPFWAKDPSVGYKLINARAETAAEKPSFRKSFETKRCLIAATGFYEWRKTGRAREPFFFKPVEGAVFAFAGLYDRWTAPDKTVLETCTILTVEANDLVAKVHNRMPAILGPEQGSLWLEASSSPPNLQSLLLPFPSQHMESYPVSSAVNSPQNNGPECCARRVD